MPQHPSIEWSHLAQRLGYDTWEDMLEVMYKKEGLSIREIASKLCVSTFSVRTKLMDLGITIRSRGGANRVGRKAAEIPDGILFDEKKTLEKLSEEYGISTAVLHRERRIRRNLIWQKLDQETSLDKFLDLLKEKINSEDS